MSIARVAYNLFSWLVPPSSFFHGVCCLKVSGISSFRRLQTSFYNVLCPHFLFSSRVSLLGFLSLYSAYSFQAGLFMVFSAPNLVFVVCVTFCLVFGIFCSYIFSMSLLPFGSFFMVCCFFCPHVRSVILVLHFTFSILCGPCFFLYACSFAHPVVCRVFCSRSLLLTFSFPKLVPVFGNFILYFFVCLQCYRS